MLNPDFVPLYQTLVWVVVAVAAIVFLGRDLGRLRDALLRRVEQGAALDVGPVRFGELRAELQAVREDLTRVETAVAKLFLATMSSGMFENLRKLASGAFGPYVMSPALERELYHLRDIGYISVRSIQSIPKEGQNLSEHVRITPAGEEFVQLRAKM